jgi:hypothetical protein
MPRGDKSSYTDKQEGKADHIAESYESRGGISRPFGRGAFGFRQEGGCDTKAECGASRVTLSGNRFFESW